MALDRNPSAPSLSLSLTLSTYVGAVENVVGGKELISTSHPSDVESGLVFVFMEEMGSGEEEEPFFCSKSRFGV